ncbi:MAG: hypothetical protein V3R81_07695 [Gammaproteobacteria bacterium]
MAIAEPMEIAILDAVRQLPSDRLADVLNYVRGLSADGALDPEVYAGITPGGTGWVAPGRGHEPAGFINARAIRAVLAGHLDLAVPANVDRGVFVAKRQQLRAHRLNGRQVLLLGDGGAVVIVTVPAHGRPGRN